MITINVLGQNWDVYVHSDDEFCELYPDSESDAAFVMIHDKEIHFNEDELRLSVVKHELCHVYFDSLCVESANLTVAQLEEVFCDLMATHGDSLLRLARKLYKHLKEEMNGSS